MRDNLQSDEWKGNVARTLSLPRPRFELGILYIWLRELFFFFLIVPIDRIFWMYKNETHSLHKRFFFILFLILTTKQMRWWLPTTATLRFTKRNRRPWIWKEEIRNVSFIFYFCSSFILVNSENHRIRSHSKISKRQYIYISCNLHINIDIIDVSFSSFSYFFCFPLVRPAKLVL